MLGKNESVQVPSRFALCYKSDCRRAGECLRYQVAECVSGERFVVCVVNPLSISSDEGCGQFKACHVLKYAYGMTGVWDRLPYRTVKDVRYCMLSHFGKTHFYRLMRRSSNDIYNNDNIFRENSFLSFDAEATLFQAGRPSVCGRRVPEIRYCKRTCFRQLSARL